MKAKSLRCAALAIMLVALALAATSAAVVTPAAAAPNALAQRYLVQAKSAADYNGLRSDLVKRGAQVVADLRQVNLMVAVIPAGLSHTMVEQDGRVARMARDGIRTLVRSPQQADLFNKSFSPNPQRTIINLNLKKAGLSGGPSAIPGDPGILVNGLMWNLFRIESPDFENSGPPGASGIPQVIVGVEDTGLDSTHAELKGQVAGVQDFTVMEQPTPICKTYYGHDDAYWAQKFKASAKLDFNGHGTWIGGNIAAALNKKGINGIAPKVKLFSLKISQWCGSAWDSEILAGFLYAADNGIDVVNISFGGYLDPSDMDSKSILNYYTQVVNYAMTKGTVIVAAAGNEHTRIAVDDGTTPGVLKGAGYSVTHGTLTSPGSAVTDYYGWYETPGGIPGVVDVSSTGNVVNSTSGFCAAGTTGSGSDSNATCKLNTDTHQPFGMGSQDQLAYYSNYGPRIDVAGEGGARKFNLPNYDRGGTPGFPYTAENAPTSLDAWETFSITSNYALEIPCYWITPQPYFFSKQCYTSIQGTSMAAPHVAAAVALISSTKPWLRHVPNGLVNQLKSNFVRGATNYTPPLSTSDTTGGDLGGGSCSGGYCHLGGSAISSEEAYGAGVVDLSP